MKAMMNKPELTFDEFDGYDDYENEPQHEYKPNNAYERSMQKPVDRRIWLVKGIWIDKLSPIVIQLFKVGLYFLGLFGTWLALGSFLAAFFTQLLLTGFQWANRKRKSSIWYLMPFGIDCILTLMGYRAIVFDTVFKAWVVFINGVQTIWLSISNGDQWSELTVNTTATTFSWVFIILIAAYVAYAPEGLVNE
jgi:hypothetical protein